MTSSAQASVVRVPELVDNILRQMSREVATQEDEEDEPADPLQPALEMAPDMPSLKACSLVSKMWRDLALRYLFHTFSAEIGRREPSPMHDRTTPLIQFLDSAPHVRDVVSELRLRVTSQPAESCQACREGLTRIISMLPRVRVLHVSRALHIAIGMPDALSVPPVRFPQTLQQLTLDGLQREYERDDAGKLRPAGMTFGRCHLQGVWDLVAQFDTVQELVINRVFLQNYHIEGRQGLDRPQCDLRGLMLRMVDLKQVSLKDLCFPSMESLHLCSAASVGKLRKIMQLLPGNVASNIRELSIWTSRIRPSQDNTMDFKPFVNLSRLRVIISNEWCDEGEVPWKDAEGLLSSFLASCLSVDTLDLNLTSLQSGGGPDLVVLPEGSFAEFVPNRGIEDVLLQIIQAGRAPCVHVGLYSWDPLFDSEMRFVPDITGKIAAAFPRLDKLGYLRVKPLVE